MGTDMNAIKQCQRTSKQIAEQREGPEGAERHQYVMAPFCNLVIQPSSSAKCSAAASEEKQDGRWLHCSRAWDCRDSTDKGVKGIQKLTNEEQEKRLNVEKSEQEDFLSKDIKALGCSVKPTAAMKIRL